MDNQRGDGSLILRFRLICAATVDSELTKADGAVLSVVLQRMRKGHMRAWPSMERIAEDADIDRRTAIRSIGRLVCRGYLSQETGKSHAANVYVPGPRSLAPTDSHATEFSGTDDTEFSGGADTTPADLGTATPPNSVAAMPPNSVSRTPPESVQSISEDLKQKEHSVFSEAELLPVDAGKARGKKARSTGRSSAETSAGFNAFWSAYPSKINRKGAWASWVRDGLEEIADVIVAHVEASNERDTRWRDGFVPHPTTYLNQERWTNEPYIGRGREGAAGRAERLGDEALRRLGEDGRDDAELIEEMTRGRRLPETLEPVETFP